ncbi:hypothetical protein N7510_008765 [Penicillium lagena]|uniref:uncharacterized protein n=1 Tax=Penicillium lagena TaxID=94218 RepID=UPI002541587C|nr:uncharacterized protein N7510_008765 [Penicillium lagena]KAJ5605984.1 hypothetical protein N7510_008765 [Penicillium lagena]
MTSPTRPTRNHPTPKPTWEPAVAFFPISAGRLRTPKSVPLRLPEQRPSLLTGPLRHYSAALGAPWCGDGCAPGTQSPSPRPRWPVIVPAQTPREGGNENALSAFEFEVYRVECLPLPARTDCTV